MKSDLPIDKKTNVFINVLSLPNQTTILVVLIIFVVYGTLIAISAERPPVTFWPLIVGVLVVSLRSLLACPENLSRKHCLTPADERFTLLQERIKDLAHQLDLKIVPQLMIAPGKDIPAVFGSWRRWYLWMGEQEANTMVEYLQNPDKAVFAEAVLLHELNHFKHGDNIWIEYARALLRTSVWLVGWAAVFLVGLILLMALGRDFFLRYSPSEVEMYLSVFKQGLALQSGVDMLPLDPSQIASEWKQVREKASTLNFGSLMLYAFGNTFPVVLIGGLMLLFLWRKLLRIREFYADAGAVHQQGNIIPMVQAFIVLAPASKENAPDLSRLRKFFQLAQEWVEELPIWGWIATFFRNVQGRVKKLPLWRTKFFRFVRVCLKKSFRCIHMKGWRAFHPPLLERIDCLKRPEKIFGKWCSTALFIGFFILILELLLAGTSTLYYFGQWPMHFAVLSAFTLISLFLMVQLVQGRSVRGMVVKMSGLVLLPHTGWLLLTLFLLWLLILVYPAVLYDFLDGSILFVAGNAEMSTQGMSQAEIAPFLIEATMINLLQVPTMVILIGLSVTGLVWVARRILTWYALPAASQRLMRVIYLSMAVFGATLAFGILPPLTYIVTLNVLELLSPFLWVSIVFSLLLALAWGAWLRQQDRRYAQVCPSCGVSQSGSFYAGKRCISCHTTLHPWLTVTYNLGTDQ